MLVSFFVTIKILDYWDRVPDAVRLFKGVDVQSPATFEKTAINRGVEKIELARWNYRVCATDTKQATSMCQDGQSITILSGNPVYLYIFWNGRAVFRIGS